MEIYITFNKDVHKTVENIQKLTSLDFISEIDDVVKEGLLYSDFKFYTETLENFNKKLEKIEKAFNMGVEMIIAPSRLEIFLEF